ncbi:MAG: hypothetical protein NZM25_07885 [Leptospiraceae bacterium]|nr:hypothetical protein [Leptospiraceae bacterium]MDW8305520.1 hypothetical protein [Leptospiraceae bacterium]
MGRTILPFSLQVDYLKERLFLYRRGLRKEEQLLFDEIFNSALRQLQSGALAAFPNPMDAVLLSALIELQQRQRKLEIELAKLQEKLQKNHGSD